MQLWCAGEAIELGPRDFVAVGGEATVYARDGLAYKVFNGATTPPDAAALAQLAALPEGVVRPTGLLTDADGTPRGFCMPFLGGHHALCRLFTRSFRDRYDLDAQRILSLVSQLRALLAEVHAAGFVVVDLSEVNVLVSPDLTTPRLIDANSFQTPTRPATAISDNVRDRHAPPGRFDHSTDWFAFAILCFQLWIGLHPYRGLHPRLHGLDARMKANASAFDPDVRLPAMCWPLDILPPRWGAWLRQTLQEGGREPPPLAHDTASSWVPSVLRAPRGLRLSPRWSLPDPIRLHAERLGRAVSVAADRVFVDGRVTLSQRGVVAITFSARTNQPLVASLQGTTLRLSHALTGQAIRWQGAVDQLAVAGSRLVVLRGEQLIEVALTELSVRPGAAARLLATPRLLATVPRHASQLFEGLVVTRRLGATWLALLPRSGCCLQLRLPELDGHTVVDAVYQRGVAVLVTLDEDGYQRHVLRFSGSDYELRSTPTALATAQLAVPGVAVVHGDQVLELFRPTAYDPELRCVDASDLPQRSRLLALGDQLGLLCGREVSTLSMLPTYAGEEAREA